MEVKIKAYVFEELMVQATRNALSWLDRTPLDYEDNDGNIKEQYFSEIYDLDVAYIIEHCESNGYLFDRYGNPIHHLICDDRNKI
jgi:hypothetical protein